MFTSIYKYELKYWFKQPATYIYAFVLLALATVTMSGMAGEDSQRYAGRVVNSAGFMYTMTRRFMLLVYLILPAVLGLAAYRDFRHNMAALLYACPFSKQAYVAGKFFSAFTVFCIIAAMLGIGFFVGVELIPGANPELTIAFDPVAYVQLYGLYMLPNLLFLGSIVFGIVLLSRNVYAGFVTAFVIVLLHQLLSSTEAAGNMAYWLALFDPMGEKAFAFFMSDWTTAELNERRLPFKSLVVYNRLLWLVVSGFIIWLTFRKFEFNQSSFSLKFKKAYSSAKIKDDFSRIKSIVLPTPKFDFSFSQQLKTSWFLSIEDFKYIVFSRSFISLILAGLVLFVLMMSAVNPRFDTEVYPRTWQLLELPAMAYSGIIHVITFLYAGLLVQRARMASMNQLIDATVIPNWSLMLSKFLALLKVQLLLLLIVMLGGMIIQTWKGYYEYEIGLYLFNLYGINFIHFAIWAMLALFVHTLLDNPYLSFFVLLFLPFAALGAAEYGPIYLNWHFLEHPHFRFNQVPAGVFGLAYSDMDGYGPHLPLYFIYKFYWSLFGILILIATLLLWKRGNTFSFNDRLLNIKSRWTRPLKITSVILLLGFISLGTKLHYEAACKQPYFSKQERKERLSAAEKKYKRYEYFVQPKIVSVTVNMDIFPEQRQFQATGSYTLVNQSEQAIDTLIINYLPDLNTTYTIDKPTQIISKDSIANFCHFDILALSQSLQPGDSLEMNFKNANLPITLFQVNDYVKEHGTFIRDDVFPRFGNWLSFIREENQLGKNYQLPHPEDDHAHVHSYMAKDADHIDFEAIVSTSDKQTALAPGALIKKWTSNGRNYFHYKTDDKITLSYLFTSGDYAVARDKWEDIAIEIYYHKGHAYNIDRMMNGLKDGLSYCSEHFSPYQFKQLRMVEFAQTRGASAHGYPNMIPAGEGSGFIARVDDSEGGGSDYAYGTAVHEVAHMWWGHQVLPADTRGAKLIVEAMAEYVNLKVKEQKKGLKKSRHYIKESMETYLKFRSRHRRAESPLMLTYPDENHISYAKGMLALYAVSDFIGEQQFNSAIKRYVDKVAFQENTYTTSLEFLEYIREATPDSLQYLIYDWFETVTLYDNKLINWKSTKRSDGQYEVVIDFQVRKYRSGKKGKEIYSDNGLDSLSWQMPAKVDPLYSLPLADYVEIAVQDEAGNDLHLEKHKITTIYNQLFILVNQKPVAVAVDPYHKLIDQSLDDNWLLKSGK